MVAELFLAGELFSGWVSVLCVREIVLADNCRKMCGGGFEDVCCQTWV